MKFFKDKEEAIEAGEEEENLVSLHWRTPKERRALELAAQFGNRKQRRDRRFRAHLIVLDDAVDVDTPSIPRQVRNERNAKRRVAKKQRKKNA